MCTYLLLKKAGTCFPVRLDKIIRFETCKGYTCVFLHDKETFMECGHIGLFEKKAQPSGLFIRVHRSHLINYQYVKSFSYAGGILMNDGTRIPISIQGYIKLMGWFAPDPVPRP